MKKILLSNGAEAHVDDEDYDRLSQFKWRMDAQGYAIRVIYQYPKNNSCVYMHREIMGEPACLVDHANRNSWITEGRIFGIPTGRETHQIRGYRAITPAAGEVLILSGREESGMHVSRRTDVSTI